MPLLEKYGFKNLPSIILLRTVKNLFSKRVERPNFTVSSAELREIENESTNRPDTSPSKIYEPTDLTAQTETNNSLEHSEQKGDVLYRFCMALLNFFKRVLGL